MTEQKENGNFFKVSLKKKIEDKRSRAQKHSIAEVELAHISYIHQALSIVEPLVFPTTRYFYPIYFCYFGAIYLFYFGCFERDEEHPGGMKDLNGRLKRNKRNLEKSRESLEKFWDGKNILNSRILRDEW